MTWYICSDSEFQFASTEGDEEPCADCRPVVVIDPEDREQVERAMVAYYSQIDSTRYWSGDLPEKFTDAMQAALREFANPTPPKPDEPTGLGAVVEDESLVEYIHLGSGLWAYGTTDGPSKGFAYADFNAVRVLSEGVTE